IEVSDDGHGMGREDAVLALDRHATSKIRESGDLVGVTTFGFRGEALPSIASVSRFNLVTSEGDDEGTRISVNGGRVDSVEPAARQAGTTVTVQSLFFNTPARRKFLRSVSSETRAATETVATLALANPSVGFTLELDGRLRFQLAPESLDVRLADVWGRDLAGTLLPLFHAVGEFQVAGFVQRPGDAQPAGRRTQLFINGRPFRDHFLVRAAEAGYRSAIAPGDRPSLFLMLEAPRETVDVNVHPAKLEVRFRERMAAERAIEEAVRLALGTLQSASPVGSWRPMPGSGGGTATQSEIWLAPETVELDETPELREAGPPLFQLLNTYIVYPGGDGVVIVDQHSAHERVLYERVMARLSGGGGDAQRLLMPVTLDLTDEELEIVEQHREALEQVGYLAEEFGGRTVALQTVPNPHPRFDAVRCFREMVADLARGRFGGWANRLERFAATYACHAAVKAGDRLDEREMRELLVQLLATRLPPHDVHGRATVVQ
ncbi:MAG: DNA mismatch repair endonuclease MutL, partial [Gemmatimonadales bacterium]